MTDIRTTEGRRQWQRDYLRFGGHLTHDESQDALDGLGIAQEMVEHMATDKIHGAYCLNCLELKRRWDKWQEAESPTP